MAVRRDRTPRLAAPPGRHRDDGHALWRYADRVAVRCHRCDTPGWVVAIKTCCRTSARFRCTGCSASLDGSDWVGAMHMQGRRPCGYCGHQWLCVDRHIASGVPAPAAFPARCEQCGRTSDVSVTACPLREAEAEDPHFGLPLRLVESTRAGLLWAYNAEHLQALHDYATATLREGSGHHRSMFSRLPQWMKLARNRVLLQRAVERLQRRLLQG